MIISLQDLIYEAEAAGLNPAEVYIRYAATDGSKGTEGGYYDALTCSIYAGATIPVNSLDSDADPDKLESVNLLFLD